VSGDRVSQGEPLFRDFANVWTPVAFGSALPHDRPLQLTVAGTSLALFRDESGVPAALIDRCPHRGAALSLGRLEGGHVQCPYHGWTFDRAGRCVHVPWNPGAKRASLGTLAVPTREFGGFVWIYTSVSMEPIAEPALHDSLLARDVRVTGVELCWQAHWTRAMENMLDAPHLPFVHRTTIGKELVPLAGERLDSVIEDHPWGWRVRNTLNGAPRPGMLDFRWPNQMNLHIPMRRRSLTLAVTCVPIDGRRTRLLLVTARDFARSPLLDWVFDRFNRRVANEDRAIVESSFPSEIPPARAEMSVRTDAVTLRFRNSYFARLKNSCSGLSAPAPAPLGAASGG
jgi:phenylpropionate dioxygenase-like ring-hydroxylating dioxygenase large terminal subunit